MPAWRSISVTATDINWGAIALGAMTGLGFALIAYLMLGVTGLSDAAAGATALILLQYSAQIGAGYIGGRLAGTSRVLHGGLSGLALAAMGAAIGLGFSGGESNLGLIVLALLIALTTGTAGGALAQYLAEAGEAASLND